MKHLNILVVALGLFSITNRADARVLYAATASGAAGRLYAIDETTGAIKKNVGPLNDISGANYSITGLAFHPITKVLYGSTGNSNTAAQGTLVSIDPFTAVVTLIGSYNAGPVSGGGNPATMGDLAFDSAGNLYGVGTVGGPQLYSINVATGQATVIGTSGLTSTTGGGLAISDAGVFNGTPTASRFGTYDSVSGAFTEIANPIVRPGGGGAYAGLAYGPGGVLYGINSAPGSPPPTFLAIIDPATGGVTNIGQSVNSLDAIAFTIPEPITSSLLFASLLLGIAFKR